MQDKGKLIFVLGGARSGKSSIAEKITQTLGEKVLYLATAAVLDQEMEKRVDLHRKRRPDYWSTIEETHRISQVIKENGDLYEVIMVDCLTILVSNLLLDEGFPDTDTVLNAPEKEHAILNEIKNLSMLAQEAKAHVVIVSNELGAGIVPANEMGRLYRDLVGWANQTVASYADEVYYTIAGLPVELKAMSKTIRQRYNLSEGD